QPVLLACSVALWRSWRAQGGAAPALLAGHSLGEFSALTCAGSLDFADALRLVRERGRFMQSAVPVGEGAMAAVLGMSDADIRRICEETATAQGGVVSAVNYNAPGQVVIAGHADAVDAATKALTAEGAKRCIPLSVSAPFHTALMQPAGEKLAGVLADIAIKAPAIPVVHNVHARTEPDPDKIRQLLVAQIASPVMWTDCVRSLVAGGATRLAECGPGNVLSKLNKRIDRSIDSFPLESPEGLQALLDEGGDTQHQPEDKHD
ncbi:MAG: ACP S-malonyltransferase, partial [Chromatocurvus sp.]